MKYKLIKHQNPDYEDNLFNLYTCNMKYDDYILDDLIFTGTISECYAYIKCVENGWLTI